MLAYSELHCVSNYSFLRGASHPHELVLQAKALGYQALALTDECSLAGVVKAHQTAEACGMQLIIGSEFTLSNGETLIALTPNRKAYNELSGFITLARRRVKKGKYEAHLDDLRFRLRHCLILWLASRQYRPERVADQHTMASVLHQTFKQRLWIAISHHFYGEEKAFFNAWYRLAQQYHIPMVACGSVLMHEKSRKPLQDVLTALYHNCSVRDLGTAVQSNAEAYLKPLGAIDALYPDALLKQTQFIVKQCHFSLNELKYQYPEEVVPPRETPISYLTRLVTAGSQQRWPNGVPDKVKAFIKSELSLIEMLHYEYYFLTVYDIVKFARGKNILCQGRGSAANSVVCYCLMITEISPDLINVLFERFISKERNEPPDIDVDFEHARREEVIQYIYEKYGRERAALAATVITYRTRSAIRDVGKALGVDAELIDHLAKSLAWWDRKAELMQRIHEAGMQIEGNLLTLFYELVQAILGFPRHLSQHVGGFVITRDKVSDIVPIENAAMNDRTVIQWDKEDLESMGLMKVDILALGMLTAIRKALAYVGQYDGRIQSLHDIPREDSETYAMLSRADSVGVFQVESRAQMSMLPRLKPRCFYDLVIQIAIVRPGPIQGGMVHPYLKRRNGIEAVSYYNDHLKDVLASTLGVPIFQEQAIRLSMVAAGFSGGEADQLRRAMASWGKDGNLLKFEKAFIDGMLNNGYPEEFAHRLFEQVKGFGGYGFPESHSASFAILCYFSSWLKCHHPAAFYCALLNSQPMGFYSPSQLVQDARRHQVSILPIDINHSQYEHALENINTQGREHVWAIRLGFLQLKSLNTRKAQTISKQRKNKPFHSVEDVLARTTLTTTDLQVLASADALQCFDVNRFQARWTVRGIEDATPLFNGGDVDVLHTRAPTIGQDIVSDVRSTRLSLRPHIMSILRRKSPFLQCKKQSELLQLRSGSFVKVAGLVTGRQRPGTAHGTIFLTLEDETGNINIVVWRRTQEQFRHALLKSKLLLIKGTIDTEGSVVHVTAGQLVDYSECLQGMDIRSRDFH